MVAMIYSRVSLAVAAAAIGVAATNSGKLSVADAMSALRAVGMTKAFTVGSPSEAAGETILVTDGRVAVQPLIVRVFPSASGARSFMAKYPPPPPKLTKIVLPGEGPGLARVFVCNVMVGSTVLPTSSGTHATPAQLRVLQRYLAMVRAARASVVGYLRRRCGG